MKKSTRALTAILLAGAMSSIAACGDDDDDSSVTPGADSGVPGGESPMRDASVPSMDGSAPVGSGDAGVTQPSASACPTHPNVMDIGQACAITAPAGSPITTDLTLEPVQGKLGYLLMGGVWVGQDVGGGAQPDATKARATLTIRPGTRIFGESALSFLLINRGSKIEAEGTASQPIVFTSGQPTPAPGGWGGLVINGRAPTNQGTNVAGEAETGLYGGPDAADDSGTLRYVRVEFTGGKVNPTNELNGIAFQGVGSGTDVDFVHSHASDDDAFEFFGGTVNAKHLVATATGDDGIDWVMGYAGKIQYAIVQQWPRVSSSDPNGIEADNWDMMPTAAPISSPTLSNLTLVGGAGVPNAKGANLRRGTQAKIHSAVFAGFNAGCLEIGGPESTSYAGNQLAFANSRVSCATNFLGAAPSPAQTAFELATANNMAIAAGTALLTDPTSPTAPSFTPVAGSPLLTGGATPADPFFTPETFIGAVGTTDWTAGWVTLTPFTTP